MNRTNLYAPTCFLATLCCVACFAHRTFGDEDGLPVAKLEAERKVDFRRDVLPILRQNCLACHSESESEAELVLETTDSIAAGGDSGAAIVAGNAEESLLFQLAAHRTEPVMPPEDNEVGAKPLNPEQLALLKLWIDQGARDSDSGVAQRINWKPVLQEHAPVFALDVSANGQFVAAGQGNDIVLYSVPAKREVQRLVDANLASVATAYQGAAHLDVVQSLAFSPDQQLIASGGFRCVKIWQRQTSQPIHQFELPEPPRVVVASCDGETLALSLRGRIELRNPQGELFGEIGIEGGDVIAAEFLSDDQLATVSEAGEVQVRSKADLTVLQAWPLGIDDAQVQSLVAIQDGKILAAGLKSGLILLWHRVEGGTFNTKPAHEIRLGAPLTHLAGLPGDAPLLAAVASDGNVGIWQATDGTKRGDIQAGGELSSLAASPNGQRLVTVTADGVAKLWDAQARKLIQDLPRDVNSREQVSAATRLVGLRKERHRVAQADVEEAKKRKTEADKNLESSLNDLKKAEEDLPKKKEVSEKAKQTSEERQAAVRKFEETIAGLKKRIAEIDAALGDADEAQRKTLDEERKTKQQEQQQAEGELKKAQQELEKAVAQQKKDEQATQLAEKTLEAASKSKERAESSVARAAAAQADAEKEAADFAEAVKVAEDGLAKVKQEADAAPSQFTQALFSHDGWRLCVQDAKGSVILFAADTGDYVDALSDLGPGKMLAAGSHITVSDSTTVTTWNLDQPWTLAKVLGDPADDSTFKDRVTALAFSDDGQQLAIGGGEPSRSGELQVWRVSDWQQIALIDDVHSDVIYDLEFSPQGDFLASCGSDRMMKVIDVAEAKAVKTFEGHTGHVLGVAWRADGRTLATAGADQVVKVWDAKEGTQRKSLTGFKKEITGIRYLGLEDRFVFAVGDGQVMSRNSNGDGRPGFSGFSDYVHRVSSSRDGSIVAAAGQDGVVRLWDPQGKKLAEFGP